MTSKQKSSASTSDASNGVRFESLDLSTRSGSSIDTQCVADRRSEIIPCDCR